VLRAWTELARWRGLVRAEVARRRLTASFAADPAVAEAHAAWITAERRLAQAEVRAASDVSALPDSTRQMLRSAVDEAERRLAHLLSTGRDGTSPQDDVLAAARAHLAADAALVAFAETPTLSGDMRLRVFVVTGDRGPARGLDLGAVSELAPVVEAWREELTDTDPGRRSELRCRAAGIRVRERIWDEVRAAMGEVRDVYVIPDAVVTGLPWYALPQEGDGYLADADLRLRVLESERELARGADDLPPHGEGLLAVGGVDFERADDTTTDTSRLR